MKKNLRENKLFLVLTPILGLAMLGCMEYLMHDAYISWDQKTFTALSIGAVAGFATFAFWVSVVTGKTAKFRAWFTILSTIIFGVVAFGILFLINNLLSLGNTTAYTVAIVIMDLVVIFMFGVAIRAIAEVKTMKKVVVAICALVLVIVLGVGGLFTYFVLYGGEIATVSLNAVQSFTISSEQSDHNGEKVKVIILAGQSNASGVCRAEYLAKNISGEDYNKYLEGFSNVKINYFDDNGNNASYGFTNTRIGQGYAANFFGPELGMAEYLSEVYADETVFIIKYAWGGSNLFEQWKAPVNGQNAGIMYTACVNFVTQSMEYLLDNNYDATIGAMCWMQGESDSDDIHAPVYGENLTAMVTSMRSDLAKYIAEDGMTFIDAGISDSVYWKNYQTINAEKQALEATLEDYVYIDTISAGLEYKNEPTGSPDLAHYDSVSGILLGHLFGEQIEKRYEK